MFYKIKKDIEYIMENDPAARTKLEVFLLYPSIHARIAHIFSHFLYKIDCQYKCNTLYLCCIKDLCRCFISETLAGSIIYYSNNSIKLFLTYRRKIKPFRIKLS